MSNPSSKKDSAIYYVYDDIPLKLYYQILDTKNFNLLCRQGKPVDAGKKWEDIVRAVEKYSNSLWYFNHLDNLKEIKFFMSEYLIVKASLSKLMYKVDRKLIAELEEKGYQVSLKSTEDYARTLFDCLQNVENLITKLQMKKNQMEFETKDEPEVKPNFDSTMAQLCTALGFVVPEDITLKRYNEYNRVLQQKRKPKMVEEDGD